MDFDHGTHFRVSCYMAHYCGSVISDLRPYSTLNLNKLQVTWGKVRVCSTVDLLILWVGWPFNFCLSQPLTLVKKQRHREVRFDTPLWKSFLWIVGWRWSNILWKQGLSELGFHTFLPTFLLPLLLNHPKYLNIPRLLRTIQVSVASDHVDVLSWNTPQQQGFLYSHISRIRPNIKLQTAAQRPPQAWGLSCSHEIISVSPFATFPPFSKHCLIIYTYH